MRVIHTDEIIQNISEMCIEANMYLPQDVEQADIIPAGGKYADCGSRADSGLSGHRHGSRFPEYRAGPAH